MDVLENIKASVSTEQFRNEFSSSSQEFNALVDSSIQAVQSKEEPSTIKKLLNELKSIAIKVGGSIMASGIISLIQQLPIW